MSRGLRHLALKTRDLRATERFYIDVLGLKPAFPHDGMVFLETAGGQDLLNFVGTRSRFDPDAGGSTTSACISRAPSGKRSVRASRRRASVSAAGAATPRSTSKTRTAIRSSSIAIEAGLGVSAGRVAPPRADGYAGAWTKGRTA